MSVLYMPKGTFVQHLFCRKIKVLCRCVRSIFDVESFHDFFFKDFEVQGEGWNLWPFHRKCAAPPSSITGTQKSLQIIRVWNPHPKMSTEKIHHGFCTLWDLWSFPKGTLRDAADVRKFFHCPIRRNACNALFFVPFKVDCPIQSKLFEHWHFGYH